MAKVVVMPQLGLTMKEGTIMEWYFHEGDAVKVGDTLFQLETEKATNEVECDTDGILRKILVAEGETVDCIVPVAIIAAADEDISSLP